MSEENYGACIWTQAIIKKYMKTLIMYRFLFRSSYLSIAQRHDETQNIVKEYKNRSQVLNMVEKVYMN